jgi:hypothetical protein
MIIETINQGVVTSLSGRPKHCRLYLVGNPAIASRILDIDPRGAFYVPPSASAFTTMAVRPARTFPTIVPAHSWRRWDTRSSPLSARSSTKRSMASPAPSVAAAPPRSKG